MSDYRPSAHPGMICLEHFDMQTFKPTPTEARELRKTAQALKDANTAMAKAKKTCEATKSALADWLKNQRNLDLATLKVGDMVEIETVALIEIGSQNKFDVAGFELAEAALFARWKKDFPIRKFKPLV